MTRRSTAFTGHVVHARHRPRAHRLRYGVFYLLLDLDEVDDLDRGSRLFAHNRAAMFSFHDRDHGPRDGSDLRAWVDTQLSAAGIDPTGGRVSILCLPRILGYAFNPLSVYFCHDHNNRLTAVLYQVANTFCESHTYLVGQRNDESEEIGTYDPEATLHHGFDKVFHVSPFIPMDCRYDITLRPPGADVSIVIRESDRDGPLLAATLHARRVELNDKFLASTILRYPLLTLKVIAGIHWDALRLWLKRTPLVRHTAPPENPVSIVVDPRKFSHVAVRAD
ncbi:MAG: DUF1365 domain-containing protein [Alphaproteobacteria bacterium]